MEHDRPPTQSSEALTRNSFKTLRMLAILLMFLGWGLPLAVIFIAELLPAANRQSLQQFVRTLATEQRWIPLSVLLCGFLGVLMFALSFAFIRALRPYRVLLVILGGSVFLPILGMALMVDSQPPGSGLAMIISLTAVVLIPAAIIALLVGLLGLLLFIPFRPD